MVATVSPPLDLEELDVETEALELAHENGEGLGQPRRIRDSAFDDRLIYLAAAFPVVALDRQQLLEGVGGAVGLERPDLHLSEALAAELRLAAQRLLGDQRVRSDRPRVDLVVHQVR